MLSSREMEYLSLAIGCEFEVLDQRVQPCVDPEETHVVIEAKLNESEDQGDEAIEYLALPILYTLAMLSFQDARSRGYSAEEFDPDDYLTLDQFLERLRYGRGGRLTWRGDYINGRRMKTDLEVRPDGSFSVDAHSRGHAPLKWIEILRGKDQSLKTVAGGEVEVEP